MKGRSPSESATTMTLLMGVEQANVSGFVHGGSIMKLVDTAAGVAAMRHAKGRVVTAQVDSLSFLAPVHIGDLLEIDAILTQAWRSSMEVEVTVKREVPWTGESELTTVAHLTMVAVDEAGNPVAVPQLEAQVPDEIRRQTQAEVRRAERVRLRRELEEI